MSLISFLGCRCIFLGCLRRNGVYNSEGFDFLPFVCVSAGKLGVEQDEERYVLRGVE